MNLYYLLACITSKSLKYLHYYNKTIVTLDLTKNNEFNGFVNKIILPEMNLQRPKALKRNTILYTLI